MTTPLPDSTLTRIAIALSFEQQADDAVRRLWHTLETGVPLPGHHTASHYRPHITLSIYDVAADDITPYIDILKIQIARFKKFPLRLDVAGIFPEAGVLFLAPRMTQTLLTLHHAIAAAFDIPPVSDHLRPDRWQPHCTLAVRLSTEQLLVAMKVCLSNWSPLDTECIGTGIRVIPEPVDRWQGLFPR